MPCNAASKAEPAADAGPRRPARRPGDVPRGARNLWPRGGSEADWAEPVVLVHDVLFEFVTGSADHLVLIAQIQEILARRAVEDPGLWPELPLRDVHEVHRTVGMAYHVLWPEDAFREGLDVHRTIRATRHVGWLERQLHGDHVTA